MKFLRTTSTGRLLAVLAGVVAAAAVGTAIAVAASGSGPVPKRERLAVALRQAAKAPAVKGVSARVSFTNSLIGSANIQGSADPLLQGTPTGRLWIGDNRLRIELQSDSGDAQIVVNGNKFWISDPVQQTVYEGTIPGGSSSSAGHAKKAASGIPTIASIQSEIDRFVKHADLSGATPGDIAGRPAYTVKISPRHDGGLLGSLQLAWDSAHGVPLRIAVYARNNPSPVLQLKVTDISYGAVPASDFNVSPPAGSKVVTISTPSNSSSAARVARVKGKLRGKAAARVVSGYAAVARAVPFKLAAPKKLVALPRHSVSLLNTGGKHGALVTYGQGLGGIVVIEQAGSANGASQSGQSSGQSSLSLPTVSIHGATAHELVTALGTVLTFSRGGVSYTVLGSVPQVAAEAAARAL